MNEDMTVSPEDARRQAVLDALKVARDPNEVNLAKDDARQAQIVSAIGTAVEGLARAKSQSRGGEGVDQSFYTALQAPSQQAVKDAITARQDRVGNVIQDLSVKQQFDTAARQKQDSETKAKNVASEDSHRIAQDARDQARLEVDRERLAQEKELKGAAVATKASDAQDKALSDLRVHLETFRGNQVAKQAAMDTYSANKALQIVKNKDPNSLTTQDLSLLAAEMSKIATGGIPTEHGIQSLMPTTLNTKAAQLASFLSSKPSDAQSAEFIKKNLTYLEDMVGESKKVVDQFHANIMKGYAHRVKPEDLKAVQADYGLDTNYKAFEKPASTTAGKGTVLKPVQSMTPEERDAEIHALEKELGLGQ